VTFLFTLDRRTDRVRQASSQALADDVPPAGVDWQPIR
jgi:hypothetical protein